MVRVNFASAPALLRLRSTPPPASMFGLSHPPPSLDDVSSFQYTEAGSSSLHSQSLSTLGVVAGNSRTLGFAKPTMRSHQQARTYQPHSPSENVSRNAIRSAFQATSFTSLRSLPTKLQPGTIATNITRQHEATKLKSLRPAKTWDQRIGLFSHTTYECSDYGIQSSNNKREIREKKILREKICKEGFRPGGSRRRLKHENLMDPAVMGEEPTPYPYSSNPMEEEQDYWRRLKALEDAKIVAGPFKGSGLEKLFSDKITYMPDAVKLLYGSLVENWGETNFRACTTDENKIRFEFERGTIDSEGALMSFMEVIAKTNEIVRKARLVKDEGWWGVVDVHSDGLEWVVFQMYQLDTVELGTG